jgi:hypothetical protein
MRRFIRFLLFAAALGVLATTTSAGPRVETDPKKEYPCTPESGAWMICVHEFHGPDADNLARQMALQIRQRDNLPAYVFNFSEQQKKKLQEEWANLGKVNPDGSPREMHVNIPEARCILIGGFKDIDAANASLKTVKGLALPQLNLPGKFAFDIVTVQEPTPDGKNATYRSSEKNPFPTSFACPNPTIQREQQVKKADPFLAKLNEDEEYSLLKNPRPWTLAVKEYVGDTMIASHTDSTPFLEKLFNPKKACDVLAATGLQAHELARFLRTPPEKNACLGFDSYVLHTRHSSIVTVGSFTGPKDPEMAKMAERILQLKLQAKDGRVPSIELFASPMEIPRP